METSIWIYQPGTSACMLVNRGAPPAGVPPVRINQSRRDTAGGVRGFPEELCDE